METILSHPFVQYLLTALAWGPPYWPEIGTGLTALLLALWIAYRTQRRAATGAQVEPPSPETVRKAEGLYEQVQAEMKAEEAPPEEIPTPPPEEAEAEAAVEAAPPVKEPEAPAPVIEEEAEPIEEAPPTEDFFTRLRRGLSRTKEAFVERVDRLLKGAKLDDDTIEELEEVMVTADIGVKTAYKLLERIQSESGKGRLKNADAVRELLREEVTKILKNVEAPLNVDGAKPFVIMVLGVNGVGKTTTIGKLAWRYRKQGKKVLVAAADTFRAAAIEQLSEWARRAGAGVIKHEANSDPGAVAFDAMKAAIARDTDVLIIDTAGRLHTRVPLMEELKKVKRIVSREMDGAPHEVLLVLDASTGQNAISQADSFQQALGVTGIAITKLDGTAKGGVIVGISDRFGIPIRLIGIGEKMHDLVDFNAESFVKALF